MKLNFGIIPLFLFGFFVILSNAYGATINQTIEGGMDIQIIYPDESLVGRNASISLLVKNNGWEDKQDVFFNFTSQNNVLIPVSTNIVAIDKLSQGGSYGATIDFMIPTNTNAGLHFLNIKYSQVLLSNNKDPQQPIFHEIAIPIVVKTEPRIIIHTNSPNVIFPNAEFPFDVEIISEDIEIMNVNVEIIPPKDIQFRGETLHSFSYIQKNSPIIITSVIIPSFKEVNTEYKFPFQVIVTYTNDIGEEQKETQTISMLLRPRTFLELTADGGIWIGGFFLAPYVSIGTIVAIPIGAIISLLLRKKQKSKITKKKKEN